MDILKYNGIPVKLGVQLSELPLNHGDIIIANESSNKVNEDHSIWDIVYPSALEGNGHTVINHKARSLVRRYSGDIAIPWEVWGCIASYMANHSDDIENNINDFGELKLILDYANRNC